MEKVATSRAMPENTSRKVVRWSGLGGDHVLFSCADC